MQPELICNLCSKQQFIKFISIFDSTLACERCLTKLINPIQYEVFYSALKKLYAHNELQNLNLQRHVQNLKNKYLRLFDNILQELQKAQKSEKFEKILHNYFNYMDIKELLKLINIQYVNEEVIIENLEQQLSKNLEKQILELNIKIQEIEKSLKLDLNSKQDFKHTQKLQTSENSFEIQTSGTNIFFLQQKIVVQNEKFITIYSQDQESIFEKYFDDCIQLFQSQVNNNIVGIVSSKTLSLITLNEKNCQLINYNQVAELKSDICGLCFNEDSSLICYSDYEGIHISEYINNQLKEAALIENEKLNDGIEPFLINLLVCIKNQIYYINDRGSLYRYDFNPQLKQINCKMTYHSKLQHMYAYINVIQNNVYISSLKNHFYHYIIQDDQFKLINSVSSQHQNFKKNLVINDLLFVLYKQELKIYKLDQELKLVGSKQFQNEKLLSIAVFFPNALLVGTKVYYLNILSLI